MFNNIVYRTSTDLTENAQAKVHQAGPDSNSATTAE